MAIQYDIIRDMVCLDRVQFDEMQKLINTLQAEIQEWQLQLSDTERHSQSTLQQLKLTTIEKERDEQRVKDVVHFCLELLATVAAKTSWTHSQRNAFDLLLISELQKLRFEDVNDIPF